MSAAPSGIRVSGGSLGVALCYAQGNTPAGLKKAIIVAIQDGEAKTYRLVRMFLYQDVVFIQNLSRNEPVT
jgi:hypothetical protein